ncbi:MAG TPA: ATP-dependent Clp protease ATP-binding subunit [Coriobacteriia bacterium]|nr:ATP-dependent Clp protease ATP-binding subunit [Coriobacteriia bacterium]
MPDNMGDSGLLVMHKADAISADLGHDRIGVEHIFLGVMDLEDLGIQACFRRAGVETGVLASEIKKRSKPSDAKRTGQALLTSEAETVLEEAASWASSLGSKTVEAPHILLATVLDKGALPAKVLKDEKADSDALVGAIKDMLKSDWDGSRYAERKVAEQSDTSSPGGTPKSDLDNLGRDLTEMARKGELHSVIGRESEMIELIGHLTGKKTPNAMILGEAGVGKTALVKGLAVEIVEGDVPPELRDVTIRTVEVGALVAGTMYRGQFEQRLKTLIDAAEADPNLILFIDEIHMLAGAGAAGGGDAVDAANILKQPLADGRMRVIGATTQDEYNRFLQKDPALWRRFGIITIPEPSREDTVEILFGLRERYGEYHNVTITDDSLIAAADMSIRYMPDRRLPDKAIALLDKACSQKRLRSFYGYTDLGELSRDERRKLFEGKRDQAAVPETLVINTEDVVITVAMMTNLQLGTLREDEMDRLLELEDLMRKRVVGQDEAIALIAKAIRKSRAGTGEPNAPIGRFLFLGPTGTGKTELAKTVTEVLFDDEKRMVRVDMNECSGEWATSRLIGSPPGYVDSERGGILSEGIRRNPYTVVLLDEIEKAHPKVHQLLLGMLEEGRFVDGLGRGVDCRNTVIIMTSNVGSAQIQGLSSGVGFQMGGGEKTLTQKDVKNAVNRELGRHFAPEFLNRFDAIVYFNPLTRETLRQIAANMLARLPGVRVTATPEAIEVLVDAGYNQAMGARPLRRAVQGLVVDPLTDMIVRRQITGQTLVKVGAKDGALTFEPVTEEPAAEAPVVTE